MGDAGALIADSGTPEGTLTGLRSDGVKVAVSVVEKREGAPFVRLQAAAPGGTSEPLEWQPAAFVA